MTDETFTCPCFGIVLDAAMVTPGEVIPSYAWSAGHFAVIVADDITWAEQEAQRLDMASS